MIPGERWRDTSIVEFGGPFMNPGCEAHLDANCPTTNQHGEVKVQPSRKIHGNRKMFAIANRHTNSDGKKYLATCRSHVEHATPAWLATAPRRKKLGCSSLSTFTLFELKKI